MAMHMETQTASSLRSGKSIKRASHTATPNKKTGANTASLQQQLEDVEALDNELKRLLVRHENALKQEGVRHEVETLERWMESYRRGLAAACKIAVNGRACLANLKEKLKYAARELERIDNEGGNPPTKEQTNEKEELLSATRRVNNLIPEVDLLFDPAEASAKPQPKAH
jgi:hypothetical protein